MKELIEYIEGKLPISNEILSELKARVVEKNLVKGEIILSENSAKKIQMNYWAYKQKRKGDIPA